ncbi:hypothetical protein Tco_1508698 [Tanacetum coccineum]
MHSTRIRHRVPVRLLALAMAAVCASRAAVKSAVSCRMASKVMAGVSDVDVLLGGILSHKITRTLKGYGMIHEDRDNDAIGGNDDERAICWKHSDGGNIGDRVKIAVEYRIWVIGIGLRFLNFFNDPRIIWEQRIAAYKGYRGGGVGGATAEVAKRRGHVPLSLAMKCSKQVGKLL